MSNLWSRFDNIAKPEEVNDAKSQATPIEEGIYRARLETLVPTENKSGMPMLKGRMRLTESNKVAFYNQNLQSLNPEWNANNIADTIVFIEGLLEEEIEYTTMGALMELIEGIPMGSEHNIKISYRANDPEKKYTQIQIISDDDLPEPLEFGDVNDVPF